MKEIKKILFTITLLVINSISVKAGICDKDNLDILKEHASKVSITYEMDNDYVNNNGEKEKGMYKIIIKGLEEYTSIRIKELNVNESYTEENKGDITLTNIESGIKKINIYFDRCDELLVTKTLNIPVFNKYSQREECINITDLDVCKENYKYQLNESTFLKKIKEYNETKKQEQKDQKENRIAILFSNIIEFLKNYYLYIIGAILLIISITVYMLIKKKKYTLE